MNKKLKKTLKALAKKANSHDPDKALKFSQAMTNVAHTMHLVGGSK